MWASVVALVLALAPLAGSGRAQSIPRAGGVPGVTATPSQTPFGAPPGTPPIDRAHAPATEAEKEGPPRLSLPTEADREAWKRDGFRLGIGVRYGRLIGVSGAPSARLIGATVRVGLRLDAAWSLLGSFQYDVAAQGLSGLRFSGTIDPTWHATAHLSLALGLGYAGISGGTTGRADIAPLPESLSTSYTFPSSNPPMPRCSGGGVTALSRVEWSIVLGPRTSTSLSLEGMGQWTGCVDPTGLVEPDTGQAVVRRQWWPHLGVVGTWGIMWR